MEIVIAKNRKTMKEYRIWKAMKARCYSPVNSHMSYQKKGIVVSDEWKNDFVKFVTDIGLIPEPKDIYSIERIDNDKNYCKENCKWATSSEQTKNRGTFNIIYTRNGETLVLKDWARKYNIEYTTLRNRIVKSGKSFDEAIAMSVDKRVEFFGIKKLIGEWDNAVGVHTGSVARRVKHGLSETFEDSLKFFIEKNNINIDDIV